MEELLSATSEPDGQGCRLTAFSEAFRRGDIMPELSGPEGEAVGRHLAPAVNALITEALARSGGTWEDIRQERHRSTSRAPGGLVERAEKNAKPRHPEGRQLKHESSRIVDGREEGRGIGKPKGTQGSS